MHTWDHAVELSLDKPWYTVVVIVKAAPDRQPEVLDELTFDEPGLGDTPGYVSHAVHRGLSGEHVIKYAQWQDAESFQAFMGEPRKPSPLDSFATAELYFSRLEYIRGRS